MRKMSADAPELWFSTIVFYNSMSHFSKDHLTRSQRWSDAWNMAKPSRAVGTAGYATEYGCCVILCTTFQIENQKKANSRTAAWTHVKKKFKVIIFFFFPLSNESPTGDNNSKLVTTKCWKEWLAANNRVTVLHRRVVYAYARYKTI